MDFKKEVIKAISAAGIEKKKVKALLEIPPQREMGDFAFPCFALAKEMKKSPLQIASELEKKIKLPKGFEKIEAKGSYLNFFVEKNSFAEQILNKILEEKENFGKKKSTGKKIIVEYCQANPMKAFHIGHIRNICMGESISRILEANGKNIIRVDYGGDVGPHVSKTIYAYQNSWKGKIPNGIEEKGKWLGELYATGAKAVKENPELEKKMREMVIKLEKDDKNLVKDWEFLRKQSMEYFQHIFDQLGVKFDRIILESEVEKEGIKIANKLFEDGFAIKDEGALLVDLKKYNLDKFLILKSDGAALYSSKDIALAKMKKNELKAEETYNVVGSEQKFYFKQLIKTLELLNKRKNEYCKTIHIPYELVMLEKGKMASREGNVITYSELFRKIFEKTFNETKKRHSDWKEKEIEENAEKLAMAAMKFGMIAQDKNKVIVFNWDKATSLEGETGPFILYSYARAKSILKKAGKIKNGKVIIETQKEKELVSVLAEFENKVLEAGNTLSPHKIAFYLINVSSLFNSFYHQVPVINAENEELKNSRLMLVKATAQTIRNGLDILNIKTIEEM